MKSLIASICILGLVGMVVGAAVMAQEPTVTATVTPQVIAVSVLDGSVDYGILAASGSNNTGFGGTATSTQTITSGSNVPINIALRSSDAYVLPAPTPLTTDWELADAIGSNAFVHSYDIDIPISGPAVWVAFIGDGTFVNVNTGTVATLATLGATATLDLKIDMPNVISNPVPHGIAVTVIATL